MGFADLFRPKYRHSKVEVRAEAVRQLTEDEIDLVIGIARKDTDASVRRIAIEKIDEPQTLVDIAEDESERSVREFARARAAKIWMVRANTADTADDATSAIAGLVAMGDQRAIAEVASRANLIEVRDAALSHLDDPKALAELARNTATHAAARSTAIARIRDMEVLGKIAVDEKRKDIAMQAFERIDDPETLEVLASKAKNKAVRTRARKRIAELSRPAESEAAADDGGAKAKKASPEEKRRHAERVQCVRTAEQLSQTDDFGTAAPQMAQVEADYAALGENPDEAQHRRFERACARFHKRLTGYRALMAEKRQAESRQAESIDKPAAAEVAPEAAVEPDSASDELVQAADVEDEASAAGDETAAGDDTGDADAATVGDASDEQAEQQRAQREQKKRERREQALASLAELTDELKNGLTEDSRKAADALLKRADKAFQAMKLGDSDSEVVEAFKSARHAMLLRVHELRDDAGWQQWANISRQEALVVKAKELLASEDKKNLSKRLKDLQSEWKAVGPAPRKKGQELWEAFKEICDQIYEGVKAERAIQAEVYAANLTRKLALCEQVETLVDSTDWEETGNRIKDLQREWKNIGPVPRKKSDAVWKRFRGACDLFFERRKPFMAEQLAQQEKNLETKKAMCEKAEALAESTDWKETSTALRELQKEWRDAGLVPRKDANAINKRFRAACDLFFARRKEFQDEQRREREKQIGDLKAEIKAIAELEASGSGLPEDSDEQGAKADASDETPNDAANDADDDADDDADNDADDDAADGARVEDLVARTLAVRVKLRGLSPEGKTKQILYKQANELFRTMLEWHSDRFKGTELDPASSSQKKRKLLAKAEEISPPPREQTASVAEGDETPEQMAERLRAAFAQNALSSALADSTDGRNMADAIADLQEAWLVMGPVPGAEGMELEDRFQAACERALRSAGVQR